MSPGTKVPAVQSGRDFLFLPTLRVNSWSKSERGDRNSNLRGGGLAAVGSGGLLHLGLGQVPAAGGEALADLLARQGAE